MKRGFINLKMLTVALAGACSLMLTGCTFVYNKPSVSRIEALAQECINSGIRSNSKSVDSNTDAGGKNFIYQMVDDDGVEFTITVENSYVNGFTTTIPFVYSGRMEYRTDYIDCVLRYYEDDIKAVLDNDCVTEYHLLGTWGPLEIHFEAGTDYSEMADILVDIDTLIDLEYINNYHDSSRDSRYQLDDTGNIVWDEGKSYDVLIIMPKSEDEDKTNGDYKLWHSLKFSDKNNNKLTRESVIKEFEMNERD